VARVGFKETFVSSDAFISITWRAPFAILSFERRPILALIHDHPQLITHIEPNLLIVSEPDRVDVVALQESNIAFGKRSLFANFARNRAARRIDRQAAEKNRPAVQVELSRAALKRTET